MSDERKYPHPDDDNNRFAWGPGQVQYEDPVTGEWKWLGGPPHPDVVARVHAEREAALTERTQAQDAADCNCGTTDKAPTRRAKLQPKVKVHLHRAKR
jgi:hypothetical protein